MGGSQRNSSIMNLENIKDCRVASVEKDQEIDLEDKIYWVTGVKNQSL